MNILTSLKQSRFVKNFSLILSGNIINQIILIALYPLISRLYSPLQIGLFAQLQAIFQISLLISTLKYDQAIIISKNQEEEKRLISLAFFILVSISALSLIPFCIFPGFISKQLKNESIKFWLYLIPFFTFLGGLQLILNNIAIKRKLFSVSNYSNIFISSSNSIFSFLFGILDFTDIGLFASRLLSYSLSVIIFFMKKLKIEIYAFSLKNFSALKETAIKYKEFPLYLNTSNVVNMLSISILSLLISRYWDVAVLGYFSMANATLNLPINMIRKTFQTVYYQRASEFIDNKIQLLKDYKRLTLILALSSIIPLIVVSLWGEKIYVTFLGDNWLRSGKIAVSIFPWLVATLIATPATVIIPVLNLQKYILILQTLIFITRIALLIFMYHYTENFFSTLKVISIHGILFNIFHISFIWNRLSKNESSHK